MRCGAVRFSPDLCMHLHLIVRFSYYTHLHLHLLRSVLARWGAVRCGSCGCVGEAYTPTYIPKIHLVNTQCGTQHTLVQSNPIQSNPQNLGYQRQHSNAVWLRALQYNLRPNEDIKNLSGQIVLRIMWIELDKCVLCGHMLSRTLSVY